MLQDIRYNNLILYKYSYFAIYRIKSVFKITPTILCLKIAKSAKYHPSYYNLIFCFNLAMRVNILEYEIFEDQISVNNDKQYFGLKFKRCCF